MNFRDLDLNLLLVFNAIYAERSISRAAKKLGMSQPAVSSALKRLREFTGDTLFYRTGSGVAPTRAAITLAIPISHALDTVEHSFGAVRSFDPATSTRVFKIGVADIIQDALVPALTSLVREEAPGVGIEFIAQPGGRVPEALRNGDIEIGGIPTFAISDDISYEPVWREQMTLIVSRTHPLANVGTPSIAQLNELNFVFSTHIPAVYEFVESLFRAQGVKRHRACTTADTHTIYKIVSVTDLGAIVGRNFARHHNVDGQLALLDLPFEMPSFELNLAWSRSLDDDQGHKWMREHALSIMRSAARLMGFEVPAKAD